MVIDLVRDIIQDMGGLAILKRELVCPHRDEAEIFIRLILYLSLLLT
jgi:hypothetical protein